MKNYPIIFGPIGGLVAGNGFIAEVSIRGRCLFEETGENFYSAMGVNPGAVASDGSTMGEAYRALVERIRNVIHWIASEAADFESFEEEVHRFVDETNTVNEEIWQRAVERVRAGDLDLEDTGRESADGDFGARVSLVHIEAGKGAPASHHGPRPSIEPSMNQDSETESFKIAAGF